MAIAIFGAQFAALWTALFAMGAGAMACIASRAEKRILFFFSILTSAFLIYMTFIYLPYLPKG